MDQHLSHNCVVSLLSLWNDSTISFRLLTAKKSLHLKKICFPKLHLSINLLSALSVKTVLDSLCLDSVKLLFYRFNNSSLLVNQEYVIFLLRILLRKCNKLSRQSAVIIWKEKRIQQIYHQDVSHLQNYQCIPCNRIVRVDLAVHLSPLQNHD